MAFYILSPFSNVLTPGARADNFFYWIFSYFDFLLYRFHIKQEVVREHLLPLTSVKIIIFHILTDHRLLETFTLPSTSSQQFNEPNGHGVSSVTESDSFRSTSSSKPVWLGCIWEYVTGRFWCTSTSNASSASFIPSATSKLHAYACECKPCW